MLTLSLFLGTHPLQISLPNTGRVDVHLDEGWGKGLLCYLPLCSPVQALPPHKGHFLRAPLLVASGWGPENNRKALTGALGVGAIDRQVTLTSFLHTCISARATPPEAVASPPQSQITKQVGNCIHFLCLHAV